MGGVGEFCEAENRGGRNTRTTRRSSPLSTELRGSITVVVYFTGMDRETGRAGGREEERDCRMCLRQIKVSANTRLH